MLRYLHLFINIWLIASLKILVIRIFEFWMFLKFLFTIVVQIFVIFICAISFCCDYLFLYLSSIVYSYCWSVLSEYTTQLYYTEYIAFEYLYLLGMALFGPYCEVEYIPK